jgi:hypothetical protein
MRCRSANWSRHSRPLIQPFLDRKGFSSMELCAKNNKMFIMVSDRADEPGRTGADHSGIFPEPVGLRRGAND